MQMGVSYYYVGDLQEAEQIYSAFLGSTPTISQPDWIRYHLDGGDLALHLNPVLLPTTSDPPMQYGAIVSFTVADIQQALEVAVEYGFRLSGNVQHQPYGKLAEIRDPWGNHLSLIQPAVGE